MAKKHCLTTRKVIRIIVLKHWVRMASIYNLIYNLLKEIEITLFHFTQEFHDKFHSFSFTLQIHHLYTKMFNSANEFTIL